MEPLTCRLEEEAGKKKLVCNGQKFVNLTPHPVMVYRGGEKIMEIPPSGTIARIETVEVPAGELAGVPVIEMRYGKISGLPPEPREDTAYIVSSLLLNALPAPRKDVVAPDTVKGAVRDEQGRIIGTTRFVRLWR